ncbi:MAG: hypothetical protein ACI4XM_07215 [Candidatus Coprovivens sp.]
MNNNLSITKIITTLSKTLNIANQMVPLYKQVKPLIIKSNEILANANSFKKKINSQYTPQKNKTNTQQQSNNITNNLPTFFQ